MLLPLVCGYAVWQSIMAGSMGVRECVFGKIYSVGICIPAPTEVFHGVCGYACRSVVWVKEIVIERKRSGWQYLHT